MDYERYELLDFTFEGEPIDDSHDPLDLLIAEEELDFE